MSTTSLRGRQILVVDDELLIAANLEKMLSEAGASVQLASSAGDARAAIESTRFDAAVLDVHLDNERSYEVADALNDQGVPFVFLSGFLTIRSGYEKRPFVPKPFSSEQVISALEALFVEDQAGAASQAG